MARLPWPVLVRDGSGSTSFLRINEFGEASILVAGHPPARETVQLEPYTDDFTLNGDGVTTSMLVNGATTRQVFEVSTGSEDKLVESIYIELTATNQLLRNFGGVGSALSNGVQLVWKTQDLGEVVVDTWIRGTDMVRKQANPFGSGTNAFLIPNAIANNQDSIIPHIVVQDAWGFDYGFRLRGGTDDRVCLIVNDNLTSAGSSFTAQATGRRWPER